MMPNSELPLIGASGAVAGVIAAYLILHPKVKVWVLALWRIPIRITAAWALGIWIAAQFANLLFESEENVAWWAHIGGLAGRRGPDPVYAAARCSPVRQDPGRRLKALPKCLETIDLRQVRQYGRRHFAGARWLG